jgi:hypothetical protein
MLHLIALSKLFKKEKIQAKNGKKDFRKQTFKNKQNYSLKKEWRFILII